MLKKQIGIKEMSFLWRQEIKVGNFYPKTFGLLQTQKKCYFPSFAPLLRAPGRKKRN